MGPFCHPNSQLPSKATRLAPAVSIALTERAIKISETSLPPK